MEGLADVLQGLETGVDQSGLDVVRAGQSVALGNEANDRGRLRQLLAVDGQNGSLAVGGSLLALIPLMNDWTS